MKLKNKQFLTVKKVSQTYDLDQAWIYYLIRNKKFPFYKINKKVLIEKHDFESFIESYKIQKLD